MHSDQETCSYCSECGISKATRKQLKGNFFRVRHMKRVCPNFRMEPCPYYNLIEAPLGGSTAAQRFWSRESCDKEGSLEEESLVI